MSDQSEERELKACPFCGEQRAFVHAFGNREYRRCVYIICRNCGAFGPNADAEQDASDDEFRVAGIAAWNRRALLDAKLAEELEGYPRWWIGSPSTQFSRLNDLLSRAAQALRGKMD